MPLALRAVRLAPASSCAVREDQFLPLLADLVERHQVEPGDPRSATALARDLGTHLPLPGSGATVALWQALATIAAADLTAARVVEPHLDALAILDQAGAAVPQDRVWGVYAAEGPPPRLRATREGDDWRLTGRKHWCSLAHLVDAALVTAWLDDERRGLFAVALDDPGVTHVAGQDWVARGLPAVTSTGLDLDGVPATEVGGPDWYLTRPGFAWGGIGVAAVWYGGAVGVARRLVDQARSRTPDQVALMHLGAVDGALHRARSVLAEAAAEVDAGRAEGDVGVRLALRVRQVVRETAEEVLHRADHALGPGPLAAEEEHAARVADLHLYLRQEHAERDQAALGHALLESLPESGGHPW
jgi:alkylation response protein AidB-like acyl-CoA dehydrogenase